MARLSKTDRVVILMHEGMNSPKGKTGLSFLRYSPSPTVAIVDYQAVGSSVRELTGLDKDIPIVASLPEALPFQPTVLLIGIAPSGGSLPDSWFKEVEQAVAAGLHVVNGLHTPMAAHPALQPLLKPDQWIWDIRQEPPGLTVGTGKARHLPCKRVLTVGTDMSVGKMSTTLELHKACLSRGLNSKVIATGQTNLMLGDDGIPLDAIRVDFASGAVEQVLLQYGYQHDIILVEGQGSIFNPASTATLPLLRGTQPTHLVLVHRAGQTYIQNFPDIPIPPLQEVIKIYETLAVAGGAFTDCKIVGIALNTGRLDDRSADREIEQVQQLTQLPCTDVFRHGAEAILDPILQ